MSCFNVMISTIWLIAWTTIELIKWLLSGQCIWHNYIVPVLWEPCWFRPVRRFVRLSVPKFVRTTSTFYREFLKAVHVCLLPYWDSQINMWVMVPTIYTRRCCPFLVWILHKIIVIPPTCLMGMYVYLLPQGCSVIFFRRYFALSCLVPFYGLLLSHFVCSKLALKSTSPFIIVLLFLWCIVIVFCY